MTCSVNATQKNREYAATKGGSRSFNAVTSHGRLYISPSMTRHPAKQRKGIDPIIATIKEVNQGGGLGMN